MKHFGHTANGALETTFILLNIAVITGFLVLVTYSKHLHIFIAPINVLTKREPKALGPLGTTPDLESLMEEEEPVIGVGKVEQFSWKAMLDFATCTECGRCQSQCPAWNTDKPLSPKLLIMDLRDHLFAKAPYLLAAKGEDADADRTARPARTRATTEGHPAGQHGVPESGYGRIVGPGPAQNERPLVGDLESGGVIDPDVLWSCTTCGACVEQCPVDIEHVDHILEMRRYQVLIESEFPSEAGVMLRNLENNANPWGVNPRSRTEWMDGLPFEVQVIDAGDAGPDDVEYLFWVGCAGAIEDRSKKVTRAFAELLHTAGVSFAVLGAGESCTGDPARRLGNEYLFQELGEGQHRDARRRREAEGKPARRSSPPARTASTRSAASTPSARRRLRGRAPHPAARPARRRGPADPGDPGRRPGHLPRPVLPRPAQRGLHAAARGARLRPGLASKEMHRCKERGFCCGAGGARMWMEERIGKQINVERVDEALGLDPDMVAHRLPVLHGHAVRRRDGEEADRRGEGGRRGARRRPAAAALGGSPLADPEPAASGGIRRRELIAVPGSIGTAASGADSPPERARRGRPGRNGVSARSSATRMLRADPAASVAIECARQYATPHGSRTFEFQADGHRGRGDRRRAGAGDRVAHVVLDRTPACDELLDARRRARRPRPRERPRDRLLDHRPEDGHLRRRRRRDVSGRAWERRHGQPHVEGFAVAVHQGLGSCKAHGSLPTLPSGSHQVDLFRDGMLAARAALH